MSWADIDSTVPLGTEKIKFGDDRIRETKENMIDCLTQVTNYNASGTLPALLLTEWNITGRPTSSNLVDMVTGYNTNLSTSERYDSTATAWVSPCPCLPGVVHNKTAVTSTTTATFTADYAILVNGVGGQAFLSNISQGVNTAISGAGGLDTGTLTTGTWYFLWLIHGESGTSMVMSESSTSPTLPSGYTYYVRVPGALKTNASNLLYYFRTSGMETNYIVDGTILANYRNIATGAASGMYSISQYIPTDTAAKIIVQPYHAVNNGSTVGVGADSGKYAYYLTQSQYTPESKALVSFLIEGTTIYYYSNYASNSLACFGWIDY